MGPDALIVRIVVAIEDKDDEELQAALRDLQSWMIRVRGGFSPKPSFSQWEFLIGSLLDRLAK